MNKRIAYFKIFISFIIGSSGFRFLWEFMRINPKMSFGLTFSQTASLLLIISATTLYYLKLDIPVKQTPFFRTKQTPHFHL